MRYVAISEKNNALLRYSTSNGFQIKVRDLNVYWNLWSVNYISLYFESILFDLFTNTCMHESNYFSKEVFFSKRFICFQIWDTRCKVGCTMTFEGVDICGDSIDLNVSCTNNSLLNYRLPLPSPMHSWGSWLKDSINSSFPYTAVYSLMNKSKVFVEFVANGRQTLRSFQLY